MANRKYPANSYEGQAQKFVEPLWLKDELGNYAFSSTTTFLQYRQFFFFIFAAHAVPHYQSTIDNLALINNSGDFVHLPEITLKYRIYRDLDIVVCQLLGKPPNINHFDLSAVSTRTKFKENTLNWVGFPAAKATAFFHHTKIKAGKVGEKIEKVEGGVPLHRTAEFNIIGAAFLNDDGLHVTAEFSDRNVTYAFEGRKSKAHSPQGMSGGALFQAPLCYRGRPTSLIDFFNFRGMGIEYAKNIIKAISRTRIIELLEEILQDD
ncbi:hypothetical protein HLH44_21200 [Gluconacetobacter sp. 1c LMG 22058]|uniref:Uncharacterized protein n=1 Tax=Gluconacetobacter dulcium TaxID=2729096 RepID=A0A7W4K3W1_9PROT|nr:hypothetical protein [Gluconacetobacter dulcium]MBB2199904.1 hypothetical protein [Gluconacetobacter dulcium]